MITLALDTCDPRGSVALLRAGRVCALRIHSREEDYSAWLLPAVENALSEAGISLDQVELFAVATGPGSFTGLRVGLTTVKAWSEVYGKPIVGVSRLESIWSRAGTKEAFIAAWYDAHRGQIFASLSCVCGVESSLVETEMVIEPEAFLSFVEAGSAGKGVAWVSLDPDLIASHPAWSKRAARGEHIRRCDPNLAITIGELAEKRAARREFSDPLELDANYVRRSDAEILWKGPARHAL